MNHVSLENEDGEKPERERERERLRQYMGEKTSGECIAGRPQTDREADCAASEISRS